MNRFKDTHNEIVKRYIYHLVDPRNGEVFYVGQTVNPGQRLQEHVKGSGAGIYKATRMKEILSSGSCPIMETVMAITGTYADACAIEKAEIAKFSHAQLTNGKGAR